MRTTLRAVAVVVALASIPAADAVAAPYGSRTLRSGAEGKDVKKLQRYLDRAGFRTAADGAFGPATGRSMQRFEVSEARRPNGAATRYEQRLVRARATEARSGADDTPTAPATEDARLDSHGLAVAPESAPEEVKAIIDAGNRIATRPYKYGGGHGRWRDSGYDCSGSVSYALHAAGLLDTALDSSGFMGFGERGRGEWVTVRANAGHAYLIVAGLRFDTSAHKQTGNRWSAAMRSARGFAGRHPAGL
jgi:cell wall-associated NlpC family hydrolase